MNNIKYIFLGILGTILVFSGVLVVKANPSYFAPTTQTATATSSPVYLFNVTPAGVGSLNGTTTLAYDTYNTSNFAKTDSAVLLLQFAASSSISNLNTFFEYSQGTAGIDCTTNPGACDWFQDRAVSFTASTTGINNIDRTVYQLRWPVASSTAPQGAQRPTVVNHATTTGAVSVKTPTRYVRAVMFVQGGLGAGGSVWAQFVPSKERPE